MSIEYACNQSVDDRHLCLEVLNNYSLGSFCDMNIDLDGDAHVSLCSPMVS